MVRPATALLSQVVTEIVSGHVAALSNHAWAAIKAICKGR
jgi:hypothetical protein